MSSACQNAPGQGRVISLANNTPPANIKAVNDLQPTSLDGLTGWLSMLVSANASVSISTDAATNASYSMDQLTYNAMVVEHMNLSFGAYADLSCKDPTDSVVSNFNQLMLRGAIMAAAYPGVEQAMDPGVAVNQTVIATDTVHQNVFRTDLRWYAGAAVLELVTILLIIPMFFGRWQLGGNLTLSPFNLALAFDSPFLSDVNSASGARGVVDQVGNTQLKFGAVLPHHAESQAIPKDVVPGRLGFGDSGSVVRPRRRARFAT